MLTDDFLYNRFGQIYALAIMGCFKIQENISSCFPHQEYLRECMDQIEILMHASLPPSPAPSHQDDPDEKGAPVRDPRPRSASEGPGIRGRRLFATSGSSDLATSTPTKVLDVARDC